jgi:ubiquinone/menaquinone biosynthesis C-methylase UbiE
MVNNFIQYVGNNFGNPNGFGGIISTKIMNIINQKQYKTVLKNIQMKPTQNVLDIGFGNGYLINKLLKQNIPIKISGIEISNDMVTKVKNKNKNYIDDGILKLFLENINKTSFEDNIFDKIYTVNTIYFWQELNKCFSEINNPEASLGVCLPKQSMCQVNNSNCLFSYIFVYPSGFRP